MSMTITQHMEQQPEDSAPDSECRALREMLAGTRSRLPWFTAFLVALIFVTEFALISALEVAALGLAPQVLIGFHAATTALVIGLAVHFLILKPFLSLAALQAAPIEEPEAEAQPAPAAI